MRRFSNIFIILVWYFLLRGYGLNDASTGSGTTVGPFQTREQCEKIAQEAEILKINLKMKRGTLVQFESTTCWEVKK